MQYLPNTKILCVTYTEFVKPSGVVPKGTYDTLKARGHIEIHGRSGNGSGILISYESLPPKYKAMVNAKYGDPYEYIAQQPLLNLLEEDWKAAEYYQEYILPDGRHLPTKYQAIYKRQAEWFNMINKVLSEKENLRDVLGITTAQFWDNVLMLIKADTQENKLPNTYLRLTQRLRKYNNGSYPSLISGRFCNQNTRKVNPEIEKLLMALYIMDERPYLKTVCKYYQQFIDGELHVCDAKTGVLFDPKDFYVNGKPYKVSEATVKHYIQNKPVNQAAVDKVILSNLQFANKHRPYNKRKAPQYCFSKITMDDISIPFKLPNGDRVWSYQVFDVTSQAVVGVSFAKKKDHNLVKESLRDMLQRIARNGWGMPAEVEVEQHLNSEMRGKENEDGIFQEDVMTAGAMFDFVRFCKPRNPMEKRAERFIEEKKYGYQKKRKGFQFRPFSKLEVNRANEDSKLVTMEYEEIKANELEDIWAYNNALHPRQDLYPGMSRWDVLLAHQNPNIKPPAMWKILPLIGFSPKRARVSRSYVDISGEEYRLKELDKVDRVGRKDKQVKLYYLPDENGDIISAHIYHLTTKEHICELERVVAYQEALVERTDRDEEIRKEQDRYKYAFDEQVRERRKTIPSVGIGVADKQVKEVQKDEKPVIVQEDAKQEGGYVQERKPKKAWWEDAEELENRAKRSI